MSVIAGYLMPHPPVLIPEVGQGRERTCENTLSALKQIAQEIKSQEPHTLILITPHGPLFSDGLAISGDPTLRGDLGAFGSPEVIISQPNAAEWVDKIIYEAGKIDVPVVRIDKHSAKKYRTEAGLDHGALVPLYFVNQHWQKYRLVHITYGLLSAPRLYAFGKMLTRIFEGTEEKTVVIASGDLSHCLKDDGPYAFHPDGPRFDEAALRYLSQGDFLNLLTLDSDMVANAGECAFRSLAILGGVFDGRVLESRCLSYEGPFGVGYGVCAFKRGEGKESQESQLRKRWAQALQTKISREDPWVRLARSTIEGFVTTGTVPPLPEGLPEAMTAERNGVFVSIKGPSGLRGCIGTLTPTQASVAYEIVENAVKAATEDPRFPPIESDELEDLTISVDVLMPSEPIRTLDDLNPKRYGIIVENAAKRGLLLPDLEGVDTAEEQIRIALQKAGIIETEEYAMKRFEVIRHH